MDDIDVPDSTVLGFFVFWQEGWTSSFPPVQFPLRSRQHESTLTILRLRLLRLNVTVHGIDVSQRPLPFVLYPIPSFTKLFLNIHEVVPVKHGQRVQIGVVDTVFINIDLFSCFRFRLPSLIPLRLLVW